MTDPREYTEEERARALVAEQLRRISHELMRGDHRASELGAMAERLRTEAEELAGVDDRVRDFTRFAEPGIMPTPADGEEFFNSPDRPVSGLGHPWSIPLRVFRKGDRAVSDVVLGRGFEGAPHMAHGGFVAAIFDDLLGFLLMLEGVMAFTASLTVNFHRGTPIGAPLRFEAWTDRTDGRKLFLAGECRDANGELLTSSEGLFIDARDHFDALVAGEGQVD